MTLNPSKYVHWNSTIGKVLLTAIKLCQKNKRFDSKAKEKDEQLNTNTVIHSDARLLQLDYF